MAKSQIPSPQTSQVSQTVKTWHENLRDSDQITKAFWEGSQRSQYPAATVTPSLTGSVRDFVESDKDSGEGGPDCRVNFMVEIETHLHDSNKTRNIISYPISHFKLPIILGPDALKQYSLFPSDEVFYWHSPRPGMLETSDEEEDHEEGKEDKEGEAEEEEGKHKGYYDLEYTIDPPYWRFRRLDKGFFVVPKDERGEIDLTLFRQDLGRSQQDLWIGTKETGDVFLALGWLAEQVGASPRLVTRYVCALNLSTNPVSFWLIHDYLRRNDDERLESVDLPSAEGQDSLDGHSGSIPAGEQKRGFMDRPKPWDIACLYKDAFKDCGRYWPRDSSSCCLSSAPTSPLFYDDAQSDDLRATRTEPPVNFLTHFLEVAQ